MEPSNEVLTKVISGKVSTSKKSALRRCASRSAVPVETDAVWMATVATLSASSSATSTVPETSENDPRTLLTMR